MGKYSRAFKEDDDGRRLFKTRAIVAGLIVFIALLGIVVRLVYLQVVEHKHFSTLSEQNYQKLVAIPPPRGRIFDRQGTPLAINSPVYFLEVIPESVDDIEDTLERIQDIVTLDEQDLKNFHRIRKQKRRFQPVVLKENLEEDEVARLSANRPRFPGVNIAVHLSRNYPLEKIAGHILGYVGRIDKKDLARIDKENYSGSTHIGKSGIERYYEEQLHGKTGHKRVEVNVRGRPLRTISQEPPLPGNNVFLTIDVRLQVIAEKELAKYKGALVAMDPRNGEILAMASVPMYDPNLFINGISHTNYNALRDDPGRPLYNRAIKGQYPPGSTVKPMIALAGLQYNIISPSKGMYAGPFYRLPGSKHKFRDWRKGGHGWVDLDKAIYRSCDVYFYDMANRLGIDKLHSFMQSQFGFGLRTGIDLPGEKTGIMPSREWKRKRYNKSWYPADTIVVGIGQGYMATTPLQLAVATSTVAMKGKRVKPRLLYAYGKQTGLSIKDDMQLAEPEYLDPVVLNNQSNWNATIRGMVHVLHHSRGTAKRSAVGMKYMMAGKTGTAQVVKIAQNKTYKEMRLAKEHQDHALFVAFAPVKDPKIAVALIAENGGGGSKTAAPIARRVIDAYLLGIMEDEKKKKSQDKPEQQAALHTATTEKRN